MATSKKEIASLWEKLEQDVNERGADGEAFVEAMKDYYSIYTDGFLSWLGALFDPKTGGFYYSNSARDNECAEYRGEICYFLPDIESFFTLQRSFSAKDLFLCHKCYRVCPNHDRR